MRTLVGSRFIRKIAVWNAYSQNLKGKNAVANRARLVSIICRNLHFARPFYSGVYGQENWLLIPCVARYEENDLNSPPLSDCKHYIQELNQFSTRFFNFMNTNNAWSLLCNGEIQEKWEKSSTNKIK